MNTQRVEGHTPTPWQHSANSHAGASSGGWHEICSNNRKPVAHLVSPVASSGYDDAETNANAEFIIHACNNIERLEKVNEALVKIMTLLMDGWKVERVSLYDEEGIEGWHWTRWANGNEEYYEVGDWSELPTIPEALAKEPA